MKLTEIEAGKKWCPQGRIGEFKGCDGQVPYGVVNEGPRDCTCIASHCMHWRWWDKEYKDDGNTLIENRRGYCGLSGKPE